MTTTLPEFVTYYAEKSLRPEALRALAAARDLVLRHVDPGRGTLDMADIGCAAGAQSLLWAELGHRVHGVDVSAELLELARRRAEAAGHAVDFQLGSATALPWATASMDVCVALELLEHVAAWEQCLDEFARVLRRGGVMLLSTTNALCPRQQEYRLPLYSWYPAPLKRRFERLARTTRPELAGYATHPAVNWFTFRRLQRELDRRGFRSLDRFDVLDLGAKGPLARTLVGAVRAVPPLRWLAHVATPYTLVLAIKETDRR